MYKYTIGSSCTHHHLWKLHTTVYFRVIPSNYFIICWLKHKSYPSVCVENKIFLQNCAKTTMFDWWYSSTRNSARFSVEGSKYMEQKINVHTHRCKNKCLKIYFCLHLWNEKIIWRIYLVGGFIQYMRVVIVVFVLWFNRDGVNLKFGSINLLEGNLWPLGIIYLAADGALLLLSSIKVKNITMPVTNSDKVQFNSQHQTLIII